MGSCCNNTQVQPDNQYQNVVESARGQGEQKPKKEMKYYGELKEMHSKQINRKQEHIKEKEEAIRDLQCKIDDLIRDGEPSNSLKIQKLRKQIQTYEKLIVQAREEIERISQR